MREGRNQFRNSKKSARKNEKKLSREHDKALLKL